MVKPDIRNIILESPSGKGGDWLENSKSMEWSDKFTMRKAGDGLLKKIGIEKKDNSYFIDEFKEISKNKAFINFMESCTHCGICIDKCQMFVSTGDINNSPVGRAEIARDLYKGRGKLSIDKVDLEKIYAYYYQCTECRRCSYYCPAGIDQSEITRSIRSILTDIGLVPDYVASTVNEAISVGNNIGINDKAMRSMIDFISDEMEEETGKRIEIPLNKPRSDILLVPSSADFSVNIDTLKGYAKTMFSLGKDYTISSKASEAANFGLFLSEDYMRKLGDVVVEEAVSRQVKTVVWGECGHGWRAANNYVRNRLNEKGIGLVHVHQFTLDAYEKGKLKFDKSKNDGTYTYHDPCNYARGGNLINEPRKLLKNVVENFVESEYVKEETFCCGAGGGLLANEKNWNEFRAWAGWPAVWNAWKTGADYMISPCAIDKAQFPFVIDYHKVKMTHKGLMDLVGYAIEV